MKAVYLTFLKIWYGLINLLDSFFLKNSFLLKHKLKIGILILTLKGFDSSGQIDIHRSMCYKKTANFRKAFDIAMVDQININPLENNLLFKLGYRNHEQSYGMNLSYLYEQKLFGIGPYYRYFTITDRRIFDHFVEINPQLIFNSNQSTELNISTGFILYPMSDVFQIELACQYSYSSTNSQKHVFRPVIGIHYSLIPLRILKKHRNKKPKEQIDE